MKRNLLLVFLFSAIVFSSCSKKTTDPAPTNTDLLVSSTWKFDKAMATGYGDVSSFVDDCLKDNTAKFVSDGSGVLDEGATKCDAADPQTAPFTWTFLENETKLSVSGGLFAGQSGDFSIVTLSQTSLVLSGNIPITQAGVTLTIPVEVSFIH